MTECKDERTAGFSEDQALNDTITWRPEFSTRRPINGICDDEEIPWLDVRAGLFKDEADEEMEEEAGGERGESEEDDNIQLFMRDDEIPDFLQPEAEMVEAYTAGATLKQLKEDTWNGPALLRKTWVGEGGADWFRTNPEWLTAYDSYHKLRVPRFRSRLRPQNQVQPSGILQRTLAANLNSTIPRDPAVDIERRLIFVSDPDKWSIFALAGTASVNQHAALQNAFSKYLAFKPSMEVNIATRGWPSFQFSLHLPYYAWRCSPAPKWDSRRSRTGRTLRQFKNVSVLNGDGRNAYLYEAQISCVLAGIDEWTYVAYCFVDTFFDGDDGEVDSQYHKDILDGAEFTQPVLYGRPEWPTHKARDFFLSVVQIRGKQICHEWERVVQKLEQSIRNSRVSFDNFLAMNRQNNSREPSGSHDSETTERYVEDIRAELIWIEDTSDVLFDLSDMLERTLDELNKFARYQSTFRDLSAGDRWQQSSCAIQNNFDQLAAISKRLQSLSGRCKASEKKVNICFVAGYKFFNHQDKTLLTLHYV
ncbi:hypothetical protein LTS17_010077 [Exophiala oligosperma]